MERKRIEYPGAFYHVIQRGNNREKIFFRDADKNRYINGLGELKNKFSFKLFGYVLMDNHYHLLLQTGKEPLHKIMFRQNMLYSRYFNKAHNRSGHLYSDRYRASLIQDEGYLFAVLRYIHFNPVRAGITKTPIEYYWSSDNCYRQNRCVVVDIDFILNILSLDRKKAIKEYFRLMKIEDEINYDLLKFIGEESFKESFKENNGKQKICELLDIILKNTGVKDDDFLLIKGGSRKRSLFPWKKAYITEAAKEGYTYKEIGENIGISSAAVARYNNTVY